MSKKHPHINPIREQMSTAPYYYTHMSIRVYFPRDDTMFYTQESVLTYWAHATTAR